MATLQEVDMALREDVSSVDAPLPLIAAADALCTWPKMEPQSLDALLEELSAPKLRCTADFRFALNPKSQIPCFLEVSPCVWDRGCYAISLNPSAS